MKKGRRLKKEKAPNEVFSSSFIAHFEKMGKLLTALIEKMGSVDCRSKIYFCTLLNEFLVGLEIY